MKAFTKRHRLYGMCWAVVCLAFQLVACGAAFARTILVPTQPVSEFADTEVSTNIAIRTWRTLSQSGSLASFFRHRFSTKYCDMETELYYYDYRFYSSSLMRWLNRDPIDEQGGMNLYGFCANSPMSRYDSQGQSWLTCFGDCVEEWRLDWSKVFTAMNIAASANAPVPKTGSEKLWLDKGVSKDTTELSRAISQGERLARKLPLGNPIRSKIIQSLGNLRRFMRNPALVKVGAAGAALTVFEGFYDIGTMLYCSIHCCG